MTGLAWAALGLAGMFLFAALGDLVSEEIRGWLDLAPRAILRLAAARLGPELRESIYQEVWLPDLIYELRGAESRPITRLVRGTMFAIGLLLAARRIAHNHLPAPATDRDVVQPMPTLGDVWDALESLGFQVITAATGKRLLAGPLGREIVLHGRDVLGGRPASKDLLAQLASWGIQPVASGKYQPPPEVDLSYWMEPYSAVVVYDSFEHDRVAIQSN